MLEQQQQHSCRRQEHAPTAAGTAQRTTSHPSVANVLTTLALWGRRRAAGVHAPRCTPQQAAVALAISAESAGSKLRGLNWLEVPHNSPLSVAIAARLRPGATWRHAARMEAAADAQTILATGDRGHGRTSAAAGPAGELWCRTDFLACWVKPCSAIQRCHFNICLQDSVVDLPYDQQHPRLGR